MITRVQIPGSALFGRGDNFTTLLPLESGLNRAVINKKKHYLTKDLHASVVIIILHSCFILLVLHSLNKLYVHTICLDISYNRSPYFCKIKEYSKTSLLCARLKCNPANSTIFIQSHGPEYIYNST